MTEMKGYDVIISNSLLHHMKDPYDLWSAVINCAGKGCVVYIMDLSRPDNQDAAELLVETYSADEPEVLKRDFYNSLCAAYRPEEVLGQLRESGLESLALETISDRHMIIYGKI